MSALLDLLQFNAAYARALDSADWSAWIDLFVDDCRYIVQPRENFERGLPLATIRLLSKAMLKDRAYGVSDTIFHDPYYQRHLIGTPFITHETASEIRAQTPYAVYRTKRSEPTEVFNVGVYHDQFARTQAGLSLVERRVVYDSELVLNSLIYPI